MIKIEIAGGLVRVTLVRPRPAAELRGVVGYLRRQVGLVFKTEVYTFHVK